MGVRSRNSGTKLANGRYQIRVTVTLHETTGKQHYDRAWREFIKDAFVLHFVAGSETACDNVGTRNSP